MNIEPPREIIKSNLSNDPLLKGIINLLHEPIVIDGNVNFRDRVSEEGWTGNGTFINPYIIDGILINGHDTLIDIRNTNLFFIIRNCSLIGGNKGIYLENVTNGVLTDNLVQNSIVNAFHLRNSKNNMIINNTLNSGLNLSSSGNNTIEGNYIINDGISITGAQLNDYLQASVTGNLINDKPLVFWINQSSGIIPEGAGQIIVVNSSNIVIANQSLSRTSVGILAAFCTNLTISNNEVTDSRIYGMSILFSEDSTIAENVVAKSADTGILLSFSRGFVIKQNSVSNNKRGVDILSSNANRLFDNVIFNNNYGISLFFSSQLNVSDNFFYNHVDSGLYLSSSGNNTIEGNHFINDGISITGAQLNDYLQASVKGNLVNGKPLIFWTKQSSGIIPEGAGQIIVVNSSNIIITNQSLSRTSVGILAAFCTNLTINNNEMIEAKQEGIYLFNSSGTSIYENIFKNNSYTGIRLINSKNNSIVNNLFSKNGLLIIGEDISHYSQNTVVNNTINGKSLIFWQNTRNRSIPQDSGQVILINCTLITISNQNISNVPIGLSLIQSSNISIDSNALFENYIGIKLIKSNNSIITWNTIFNNRENGVLLENSFQNSIFYNSVTRNDINGYDFHYSNNNTISTNVITHNRENGVNFFRSNHNANENNIIARNAKFGMNLIQSGNNTIIKNNFVKNNEKYYFQANDHRNQAQANVFDGNYWEHWRAPDLDEDGIVDDPYQMNGSSSNIDPYPKTNPHTIEIHLLTTPIIIFPNGGAILRGDVLIEWEASAGVRKQPIYYMIFYTYAQLPWTPLISELTNTSYIWDTNTVPDRSDYRLIVIAYDGEGLFSRDLSNGEFIIQNGPSVYNGVTLLKILIGLNLIIFAAFLLTISYSPLMNLKNLQKNNQNGMGKLRLLLNQQLPHTVKENKAIIIALCGALLLSIFRAWLIDPPLVVIDGYDNYATQLKDFFFDWTREIDKVPRPEHQLRVFYSLLIAIVLIFIPFLDLVLIGRTISLISFFISIYMFSQILKEFQMFSEGKNKERVTILLIMSPTLITNMVRFETDILFLALTLFIIHRYLKFQTKELKLIGKLQLLLAICLLLFTKEVGLLLLLALAINIFLTFSRKNRYLFLLGLVVTVIIGIILNVVRTIVFYVLWSVSTWYYANEIINGNNWFVLIEIVLGKLFDPYVLSKTLESLFWAFIPSILFVLIGIIRMFSFQPNLNKKYVLSNVIFIYFTSFTFFYILLKVGRGLDRFWLPIIPIPFLLLPFTIDIKETVSLMKETFLNGSIEERNGLLNRSPPPYVSFRSKLVKIIEKTINVDKDGKTIVPSSTFKALLGLQLIFYLMRMILSLLATGVLPVYK